MTHLPGPIDPPAACSWAGPHLGVPECAGARWGPRSWAVRPVHDGDDDRDPSLYREVWGPPNEATLLIDGTSRAGIEAAMVSLIRPGDRVLVPVFGRFGHLLAEIAERALAEVHTIEVPWGEVFPVSTIREAIERG